MSVLASTIRSIESTEVTLGEGEYTSNLTITNTGGVVVSTTATSTPIVAVYIPASVDNATITNFGTITSSTPQVSAGGIAVEAGAPFFLENSGVIAGSYIGSFFKSGGYLDNKGTISGALGGVLNNIAASNNSGLINGSLYGIVLNNSKFSNAGEIRAETTGAYINANSTLDNVGTILAETGVIIAPGGYIINGGLISTTGGSFDAIYTTGAVTLAIDPGAKFIGNVVDTSGHSEIILNGGNVGSINLGFQFTGFKEIKFDSGSSWTLEGSIADLSHGQIITGLAANDKIILDNFTATAKTYVSGIGLILGNEKESVTIDIQGTFSSDEILITDNANSTSITAPCFCAGTKIATKGGEVAVEHLKIGDLIKTMCGNWSPIKWIGSRTYDGRFISGMTSALPILIRRDAIAKDVPSRDLYVSPDHAICEGGMLIPAWRLVNGVSIIQISRVEQVSYYHIELDCHNIIFAENCPTESFLNEDCRGRFQNSASFLSLYPGPEARQKPCLPRLDSGLYLHIIQSRLNQRAGIISQPSPVGELRGFIDEAGPVLVRGWAQDSLNTEKPVLLYIFCDDQVIGHVLANKFREDLLTSGLGTGCHAFEFILPPMFSGYTIQVRRSMDKGDAHLPRSISISGGVENIRAGWF